MKSIWKNWGILMMLGMVSSSLQAQCKIDSLVFDLTECDGGKFYAVLNFKHDSTSNAGFKVAGNGNDYGAYIYDDLPIKIGPLEGDGETPYEFVITDKEHPNCSDFIEVGMVLCEGSQCSINDLEVFPQDCA
ncbi:MAG: hypothetical protein OEQ53_16965, partial [Saprospiraceae bacterium]|nr:hypothetical protein [Saprospiraceae bacterium]